ncbi:16S rRNA (cytosine(1402)-N(4))-methyltransferase RsmH [Desulfovibrio subterraneus]|uniref:Ribosomal RNA small subunit methyltransferase H n=1 Tax=Desulfovibrio subterraneus TaxID=2718620 RepID=A0A7J0BI57_9BACT|nr:16S rRNA (cytosine(1402)-N(4))-methyltransferase RsmH [Desulfovibrio subterraneus]WBF67167.1 16S rRNA (cytosine(1402)-N(4))-methyltransferase RsmH [Desulfovibrio subterraneus]GFM32911.1 ribosomal RNA small subunit methyltransferase H [Desulfovibrio subterraneus]
MTQGEESSRSGAEWSDHVPVLLNEVLEYLAPKPGGYYLDGTLGLGGHSEAIMEAAQGKAQLVGLDRDMATLGRARKRLERFGDNVHLFHSKYSDYEEVLDELGWDLLDGALLDIGVSSMQLDQAERGFSFNADGPLDMRMDPDGDTPPASHIVNKASADTLRMIIGKYGEEPMGGRITNAILDARAKAPIETTLELAKIVEMAYPAKWRAQARNHPATRTFQALRMAVNGELDELESFLETIIPRLRPGGRVVVISFHSLEDRLVKHAFADEAKGCICPRQIPVCVCHHTAQVRILTKKPVMAGEEELARNRRSSSAKLRAAEKL